MSVVEPAPDLDLVGTLEQMGFPREMCIRAAISTKNDASAASDWLLHNSNQSELQNNTENWRVVSGATVPAIIQRQQPDPLSVLSNHDTLSFQDTGSGIVVMSLGNPIAFVHVYECNSWGRYFSGYRREVMYELQDLERRPLARLLKPFAWISQDATVYQVGAENDATTELGKIRHEFDMVRRKLVISDSTPGHSVGFVRVEGFMTDGFFSILLGESEIGRISHPKNGMGLAKLELFPGALDAFRANRMRTLLVGATLLISDVYWGCAPNAFLVKVPLLGLR
jgi:hypothetical protein